MTLPCIVCHEELKPIFSEFDHNQPYKGTTFISEGHYGSTVWDPMDGSFIEINICDECLKEASQHRMVLVNKIKRKGSDGCWPAKLWSPKEV